MLIVVVVINFIFQSYVTACECEGDEPPCSMCIGGVWVFYCTQECRSCEAVYGNEPPEIVGYACVLDLNCCDPSGDICEEGERPSVNMITCPIKNIDDRTCPYNVVGTCNWRKHSTSSDTSAYSLNPDNYLTNTGKCTAWIPMFCQDVMGYFPPTHYIMQCTCSDVGFVNLTYNGGDMRYCK